MGKKMMPTLTLTLCEKCPNTEFFLVVFSCIWTEYGDLLRKSPYSVQIQENTDHKKLRIWTLFTQCDNSITNNKNNPTATKK